VKRNEQTIWGNYATDRETTGGVCCTVRKSELQTARHTTPLTDCRDKIIYCEVVEDFRHFATETSVALLPNGFKFGKCALQYSFEFFLSFLSPD